MAIGVRDTAQYVMELDNRMPFHFGNVTVETAAQTVVEVTLDVDGEAETGLAMGTFASPWFLKDPSLSLADIVESFEAVTVAAREHAEAADDAPSVFALWRDVFERQREWAADTDYPPLLWGYGVSLVEQAAVDAYCRHEGVTFHDAVHDGALGLDLGAFYDELDGREATEFLPADPERRTAIRHTVGMADPLTADDVPADERLDDGLPRTMAEYVEQQGVRYFKIKLGADLDADRARLRRIADVLAETGLDDYAFTVDANEQYETADEFRRQWEAIEDDPALDGFLDNLLYVEQPLPRDEAFTDRTRETFTAWDDGPAVIIDESDDLPDRLGTALDCGYAGTSHKNCKGVFKGVANRCLVEHRRRTDPDGEYAISGEDLTTLGPVEFQQDTAVTATLGMDHVERNGHHYFRGLSMLPDDVQEAALDAHPDLYRRHERGFVTLDIRDGTVDLDTVVEAPFGRAVEFDPSRYAPLSDWDVSSLTE